jgi:deoxyhypusine synthase
MAAIRDFMERGFRHFNARETLAAAKAYQAHLEAGGKMLVSLAGAMSTGELGISLSRMIRAGYIHAISCTGANLEEEVFNLISHDDYQVLPHWRALSAEMEKDLYERGMNRVTDTSIPETAMRDLERLLIRRWRQACEDGVRKTPAEFLWDVLGSGDLDAEMQIDPRDCWMIAAMEAGIPVFAPGWEDSTTGNMLAASVMSGRVPNHQCVTSGTEQFERLMRWYLDNHGADEGRPSVGFFQIGGGIAGDFAICAVPCLIQDLRKEDTPFWGYFAQISEAVTSYGGYSGAPPNEKITWGKLDVDTPKFVIESDATIVAPLIFGYLLGD